MCKETGRAVLLMAIALANPLILIHGYSEDAHVWDSWREWLSKGNITNYAITFKNNDKCGTVQSHAAELDGIVNQILNDTGSDQVNFVVHSKGGLDARSYIAQHPGKVANLIMIATPNEGTEAAYMDLTDCSFNGSAGLEDLKPGSEATKVADQKSTKYYAIAGDYPSPCFMSTYKSMCFVVPNDGFVTTDSALSHYESLGTYNLNHTGLLSSKEVYDQIMHHFSDTNDTLS